MLLAAFRRVKKCCRLLLRCGRSVTIFKLRVPRLFAPLPIGYGSRFEFS
jgi:hypothetical protein